MTHEYSISGLCKRCGYMPFDDDPRDDDCACEICDGVPEHKHAGQSVTMPAHVYINTATGQSLACSAEGSRTRALWH